MHQYPSDISRAEYDLIREDLEGARKKTRPGKYDLYDVFCAVLYVIQGGIQWRMLPSDYPKWQSVYYHFRVWSEKDETGVSILDKVLQKLVKQIRNEDSRRDKTTFGIVAPGRAGETSYGTPESMRGEAQVGDSLRWGPQRPRSLAFQEVWSCLPRSVLGAWWLAL